MKKAIFIFAAILLICSQVFAEDTTLVCETKGQGATRDEAIKNALYQAVSQLKGMKVSSGRYAFGFDGASADVQKQPAGGKTVSVDAVSVQAAGTVSQNEIEGLVKTYEILEEKKLDDKSCEVKLKVTLFDYLAPDGTKRLRIAIMPIRAMSQSYQFLSSQIPWLDIVTQLSHKLSMNLSSTNKFAVLDREYILEFAKERNILAADAPLQEQAKIGKQLGADYILVGTISDARLIRKQQRAEATGYNFKEFEADFVFDYRLIAAATMQVKIADTVNLKLLTSEIKELVKQWDPEELDIMEIRDGIIAKAAASAVETIIDRLYPARIASVEPDGQIILNQGGKRITEGMLFDVLTQGKEIIDSDTKESLGMTENRVAAIKIDKVSQKISYARLVDGDIAKITKDLICRPQPAVRIEQGRKSQINKTSSGGVILPFDRK